MYHSPSIDFCKAVKMHLTLFLFILLSSSSVLGLSQNEYDNIVGDLTDYFLNDVSGRTHLATALRLCKGFSWMNRLQIIPYVSNTFSGNYNWQGVFEWAVLYPNLAVICLIGQNVLFIRFHAAFHDCVGGCDGCINLANAANAGLESCVADLNTRYNAETISLTRADYWAIAGIAAVKAGIQVANRGCNRRTGALWVIDNEGWHKIFPGVLVEWYPIY